MGNLDAENKFYEVVKAMKKFYGENNMPNPKVDEKEYQMVLFDIEAAIPGLTDVMLGRVLIIKADCLQLLYFKKRYQKFPRIFAIDSDPDPDHHLIEEALDFALKGRKILKECGSTEDLPRVDNFIEKLKNFI